jgi:site-specific recombinase XerD
MKFLYTRTLGYKWPVFNLIRVTKKKKLPVVLSPQEVRRLLRRVRRPVVRMSLTMMYSCGLRASEATHLNCRDIDSQRMVVCVRNGKGAKDRYVPLPERVLERLRTYWLLTRPKTWLFPSTNLITPVSTGTCYRALQSALALTDISKNISCHTLRHSYATHLMEKGVDMRVIQGLLGHRSPRTTFIYMHLTQSTMQAVHKTVNQIMVRL